MAQNAVIGHYHFALRHGADPQAFVDHMHDTVFNDLQILRPTRITRGFGNRLLQGDGNHFLWEVTADLMTDRGYDFAANADLVGEAVKDYAVLVEVDAYEEPHGLTAGG